MHIPADYYAFKTVFIGCIAGPISDGAGVCDRRCGLIAGVIAYALYNLIALLANVFFYHRFAFDFTSVRLNRLGLWAIVTPVNGGLIVGLMAKYGTSKIKGHGIPEVMEAVLVNRSPALGDSCRIGAKPE